MTSGGAMGRGARGFRCASSVGTPGGPQLQITGGEAWGCKGRKVWARRALKLKKLPSALIQRGAWKF